MNNENMPDDLKELVNFHGHLCFGVLFGYRACNYAIDIIGKSLNMMVVTENDNCGNDAVRLLLECTTDNGKLIIRQGKKQSWSFYNKDDEEGIKLTLNPGLAAHISKDKDQAFQQIIGMPANIMFFIEPFECNCSH